MTNAAEEFCDEGSTDKSDKEGESEESENDESIWEQAASSKKERDTRFSAIQDTMSREDTKALLQKEAMEESSEDGSKTKSNTT